MPRYSDLFTLNPIETVIQIEQADKATEAQRLVSTFVITESLGQQIEDVALPQFDFNQSVEGKGIFIVGNYGTGKSHVMSFLSIIAENGDYLQHVRDEAWRQKLAPIAGKYKVHRAEIAAPEGITLYGIVTHELTEFASKNGLEFEFKAVPNMKTELERFTREFEAKVGDYGVLLVIDELLDYLRGRTSEQQYQDLGVLRVLGEFCHVSRFKFIAGLQQSLFDNPQFNHFASELQRIRQRYHDFVIDSKGVSQLIDQYLFAKTDAQRQQIREMLLPLADQYEVVGEKLDQFVALFPAHPDFIDEFQRVVVVERREILTTLTRVARTLQDREASSETLDLITADDYYPYIEQDRGLRANRDILRVINNVQTITDRIRADFGEAEDKKSAIRLVNALAVNRLTTPSITDAVGLTPKDLKNNLIWRTPVPMHNADFLTGAAKRLLDRARQAVNGQFLTMSEASGQWYIDPTRVVDYDQQVETYAATTIPDDVVQRYLNELFTRALELDNEQPVIATRLWEYNTLIWTAKNVARPGWLFFGFPTQRSTAQPPKDFYLFIVPSRRITDTSEEWQDAPDESYWFIEDFSDEFLGLLKKYASARELEHTTRGDDQKAYRTIAENRILPDLIRQYVENAGDWMTVRWNGQRKKLSDWVRDLAPSKSAGLFKSKLEAISEVMFAPHFEGKFPNYPAFEIRITENARAQNAQYALEIVCKIGMQVDAGKKVLKALGLYEDGTPTPDRSPWLDILRRRLRELGPGQVLNNSDLFEKREDRVFMKGEPIEAEWLHVVIAAGVESGDLVAFGRNNVKYGAADLTEFSRNVKNWEDIIRISAPAEIPLPQWRKLFVLLKVNAGLLATPQTYQEGLQDFQTELARRVTHLVETRQKLSAPLPFAPEDPAENRLADATAFDQAQAALEGLQPLNTRAKMSNLNLGDEDIAGLEAQLKQCEMQERVLAVLQDERQRLELSALERYQDILKGQPDFVAALDALKQAMREVYADPASAGLDALKARIGETARVAIRTYQDLKKRHTLGKDEDKRKKVIIEGPALKSLNKLAGIRVLNVGSLDQIRNSLGTLPVDQPCSDDELLRSPTSLCPYTRFDPRAVSPDSPAAQDVLAQCESEIGRLLESWTQQLLSELGDPAIRSTLSALKPADREVVDTFAKDKKLPAPVDDAFVRIMNEALSRLKTRKLQPADVAKAIFGDGVPLKASELRERFEKWIKETLGDEAQETVRFVLDSPAGDLNTGKDG